jgi:uncharacterized membrane protein YhaH (DUF805 family)
MEQNQPQPPVFNPQPQQVPPQVPQYQPRVTALPTMGPIEAVKTCLRKYFDFTGRARRSEYWWFMLFLLIVYLVGSFLAALLSTVLSGVFGIEPTKLAIVLVMVLMLAFIIPAYSALTRRLHDTGRSGWWVVLAAVLSLIYGFCYSRLLWPFINEMGAGTDPFEIAQGIANAMMESPTMATIMSVCGMACFIMGIVLLIFALLDSKWTANKYGSSPKYQ